LVCNNIDRFERGDEDTKRKFQSDKA